MRLCLERLTKEEAAERERRRMTALSGETRNMVQNKDKTRRLGNG